MIITRTPFRLSFFGGGTDYSPWYEKQSGIIIASAMARYCYLNIRFLPPFFEHKTRVAYSKFEVVSTNQDIEHPSIRNCLKFMNIEEGLEIHHDGDLPARSGIGSSSSFTVGLLHALHALTNKMVSQRQLAEDAINVEQNLLNESVGVQDQIMAAHGGFRIIEIGEDKNWNIKNILLPSEYIKDLEDHVLLGFSGVSRTAEQHAKNKIENIKQGKITEELKAIAALAQEALQSFQNQASFDEIGRLLDQSWQFKRRLARGVSSDWMDDR